MKPVVDQTDTARDLARLGEELKRLETEYKMFFAGQLPRPPWETRSRVEAMVRECDRRHIPNYGDRFRFSTLQARYAAFIDLWDRGLRAREEGRSGPFHAGHQPASAPKRPESQILHVSSFCDPMREVEKLRDLYDAVADARRQLGEAAVPFHKFAELVKDQVRRIQAAGRREVAFRVALKDGKVSFTARALKGPSGSDG